MEDYDHALDHLIQAPGLILDLRGHGGGSAMISDAIGARLPSETLIYGHEAFRLRLPFHGFRRSSTYRPKPRGSDYQGTAVRLIGAGVMSDVEKVTAAIQQGDRAKLVGCRTAGASGNPVALQVSVAGLPGCRRARSCSRMGPELKGSASSPICP